MGKLSVDEDRQASLALDSWANMGMGSESCWCMT